ncbi:hypothetical protein DNG35_09785 [Mesonia sp. K7]|nr:hypothetical protein DNG35_09785 [Mesonia sp. K7]
MTYKTYIALTLAFIFSVKFLAVDANGLNFLSNSGITFVKPFCKKKNTPKIISGTKDFLFSQIDHSFSQKLVLNSFCNPQLQLKIFGWETGIYKLTSIYNSFITTTLNYRYLEKDSPPPRLA